MNQDSILIARPEGATQLVLLFHGVGSSAANMAPMGDAIAKARPDAVVVSVDAPLPSTLGSGREWFSVVGITEENRPGRIARAMPAFLDTVAHWQRACAIGPSGTVLVGFSQGAILSLESTQLEGSPAAHRVIALAGRFASSVRVVPPDVSIHFIHGEEDNVILVGASVAAAEELTRRGGRVTLDLLPQLAHGIDGRVVGLVAKYLGA